MTDWGIVSIESLFKAGDSTGSPGGGYANREEEPGKWLGEEENQERVSPKPKEERALQRGVTSGDKCYWGLRRMSMDRALETWKLAGT